MGDVIKKIYEEIWEELDGAEHYAKRAATLKHDYPELARLYASMSEQEMHHSNALADEAARMQKNGMSEGDRAIHEFVREMQTEKGNRVRMYMAQYK